MAVFEALRVAAIIPVLNEAGAIGPTLAALPRQHVGTVIVVDGGSSDGTVAEARAAGAEVLLEFRRGYGRACASGAKRASELGAEVALFLDGDGSDAVEEAPQILAPILEGSADFVLASRTLGRREPGSMGLHQLLAGRVIGWIIGLFSGVSYSDMCAFRAIRLGQLASLGMRGMTYGWNVEMQMRAARANLRVREVALPYRKRIAGQSKVAGNIRGSLMASGRIVVTVLRIAAEMPRRK